VPAALGVTFTHDLPVAGGFPHRALRRGGGSYQSAYFDSVPNTLQEELDIWGFLAAGVPLHARKSPKNQGNRSDTPLGFSEKSWGVVGSSAQEHFELNTWTVFTMNFTHITTGV